MPQTASPFGLRISKNQNGVITRAPERLIVKVSANGTLPVAIGNIAAGDPVYIDNNGLLQQTPAGVATAAPVIGTFQGVEYSDSVGKRVVSNQWRNPGLFPNSELWFWYTAANADTIFEMQTSATVLQNAVGSLFGVAYGTVNPITGFSTASLDTSGANANGGLILYNIAFDPILATSLPNNGYAPGTPTAGLNNWGDPFVNVYVKLAKPQFAASVTGF